MAKLVNLSASHPDAGAVNLFYDDHAVFGGWFIEDGSGRVTSVDIREAIHWVNDMPAAQNQLRQSIRDRKSELITALNKANNEDDIVDDMKPLMDDILEISNITLWVTSQVNKPSGPPPE